MESHECAQCDTSKAWAQTPRPVGLHRFVIQLDEWLHRFECQHRHVPGHRYLCEFVDWYAYGVPLSSLRSTGPQVKERR